ncbi:protein of unknown function [Candidatus Filomicrobium marinum]|nr:protein of unknown function [Candidatus Filomicrobium marinum]
MESHTLTGAAAIKSEHEPGPCLAATMVHGENTKRPAKADKASVFGSLEPEPRPPHQRSVTEHPKTQISPRSFLLLT